MNNQFDNYTYFVIVHWGEGSEFSVVFTGGGGGGIVPFKKATKNKLLDTL